MPNSLKYLITILLDLVEIFPNIILIVITYLSMDLPNQTKVQFFVIFV